MVGALLVAVLSAIFVLVVWPEVSTPPIIRDLIKQQPHASLDEVLARKFPKGSPGKVLVSELEREGFKTLCPKSFASSHLWCSASADWHPAICDGSADIFWKLDAKNRITMVEGHYTYSCGS